MICACRQLENFRKWESILGITSYLSLLAIKAAGRRSQIPPSVLVEPPALLANEVPWPGEEKVGIAGEMGVSGSCEEVVEGISFYLDSQGALMCELLLPGMQWEFVAIKWGLRRAIQAL